MAGPKRDALVKSVESLITERQAIALKERELITKINAVLNRIGYQVVGVNAGAAGKRAGRRGHPLGRGRKQGAGRRPRGGARRRGRPLKEG